MKKKLFLAIIAVLVVCLMCGVLFVACNDDPPADDGGNGGVTPPPVDPDNPDPGTDPVGPGTDDPKGDAYDALIDAFDAVAQDESKEFTFALQITEKNDDGTSGKEIFGIAMEQLGTGADRADYLYAAVNGEDYVKFNGFDLGHLVMTLVDDWFGLLGEKIAGMVPVTAEGFKGGLVKTVLVGQLLGDYAVSESGDAFMFELTLGSIVSLVDEMLAEKGGLDGMLGGAIGTDTVTTIVDKLAELMKIELTENTLSALLNTLTSNYRINFYFGFDGATADDADPFDGLLPGVQDARDAKAKNLINFEGEVIVEGLDANNGIENTYVLDIDVDINPFVAFDLIDLVSGNGECMLSGIKINSAWKLDWKTDIDFIAEIMAMLEDAGYIHISLDKYAGTNTDADPVRNLFTLHYDSAEGKAVVSVATNEVTVGEQDLALAAGGVYDIDALAQVINMLLGNTSGGAAEGETPVCNEHVDTDPADCVCDVCGTALNHVDEDKDSFCDTCGACLAHKDADGDGLCDNCKQFIDVMAYVMGKLPALGKCFTIENGTFDVNEEALADVAQQVLNDTAYLTNLTSEEIGGFVTAFEKFAASIGYNPETGLALSGTELKTLVNTVLTALVANGTISSDKLSADDITAFADAAAKIEGLINFTTTGGLQIGVDNALDIAETFLKFFFPDKVDAIGQAKAYVSDLLGGHAKIRIKVAEGAFSFGHFEENEKIKFEDLTYNLGSGAYVETVTGISKADGTAIAVGDTVNVTGKGFDGTEITAEGVVMAIGNDGTYYVGIYTDLNTNLGVLESIINSFAEPDITINIQPSWPFYGVLAYTPAA